MDPNNQQPVQPNQNTIPTPTSGQPSNTAQPPATVAGQQIIPQSDVTSPQPIAPDTQTMQSTMPGPQSQNSITPPMPSNGQQPVVTSGGPKKPKLLIIVIGSVLLLGLITVLALIFASPNKSTTDTTDTTQEQTLENVGPQPAEAIDVEQSNSAINQDISELNTDNDYPATQLDDKELGL